MATQKERKIHTRRKLINAAKRLFDKHGFDQVSVDQIVKNANVAKGTFYQYYETKVDVLADVARDAGADKFKAALEEVENGVCALEMLYRFVYAQCDWFEANANVAAALVMASVKNVGQELQEEHRHSRVFLAKLMKLAQIQGSVREDLDPKEISKVIGAALVITVLSWHQSLKSGGLQTSMKQSLDIILNGAKNHD